jgi:hypothetical protein
MSLTALLLESPKFDRQFAKRRPAESVLYGHPERNTACMPSFPVWKVQGLFLPNQLETRWKLALLSDSASEIKYRGVFPPSLLPLYPPLPDCVFRKDRHPLV